MPADCAHGSREWQLNVALLAPLLDLTSRHLGCEVRFQYGERVVDIAAVERGAAAGIPVCTPAGGVVGLLTTPVAGRLGDDDQRFLHHVAALVADIVGSAEGRDDRDRVPRVVAALGGGMRMVVQPIADLTSRRVIGLEALARVDGDRRSPDRIFVDARAVGLGPRLELAAIRLALELMPRVPRGWYLSLNVSPELLVKAELRELLRRHAPGRLVLELTEHARVDDYDELQAAVSGLRSDGHRLAIDDLGAGFASLRHVLQVRPDLMKLDISLTRDIDGDPVRRALARAIIEFAVEIGAVIVAEGIETEGEREVLLDLGVTRGQGYLLGRPAPLAEELGRGTLAVVR